MSSSATGWPQLRPSLSMRLHQKVSNLLLDLGDFLSKKDSEWFKGLQHKADWDPYTAETSLPKEADVRLEHLLYGDLYAVEDFDELKYGMDRLFREHEVTIPKYGSWRWHEWVNQRKNGAGGLATNNIGYLDLSEASLLFRSCHVMALGMEGYVALGLKFTPSEECRNKIKELLAEGGKPTILFTMPNLLNSLSDLSLFSRTRYFLGFSREPRSADLQRKIDRFFLRCNREAADLLENHIGSGLAPRQPLPSLEIISTDISRNELVSHDEDRRKKGSSKRSFRNRFWRNIGQHAPPTNPWRWEWGQLYRTWRSDEYGFRSHQMVVHRADLVQLEDYRIDDREPREGETKFDLALRAYLIHRVGEFGALLAIREQFLRFRDRLVNLRNLLSPQLRNQSSTGLLLKVLIKGTEVLSEINAVRFSQARLWSQVNREKVKNWLFRSSRGAKRSQRESEEAVDFVEDWTDEVKTLKNGNQNRLQRIDSAYEKLFTIFNAHATVLLQFTVAGLTVLLLWLTILMVMNSS